MNTSAKAPPICFCSSNYCSDGAKEGVTARRTKQDFAQQMKLLIDVYFPNVNLIRLVVDNLNTHTPAALYETLAPERSAADHTQIGVSLHTQAWELAQHGRM